MKPYSSANLLAKEFQGGSFFQSISDTFSSIFSKTIVEVEIPVKIPYHSFLRTKLLCEFIESSYETPVDVSDFVNVLYLDFIHRHMKRYNPKKMYEEITKYTEPVENLEINDPMNNKIYLVKKKPYSTLTYAFYSDKDSIRRGEMFLAEIDELTGNYFTVEDLVSRLWFNFMRAYSEGHNEKAVDKIIKMLKTHLQ
ncbi:hypothetical protein [Priestia aryabhattai]